MRLFPSLALCGFIFVTVAAQAQSRAPQVAPPTPPPAEEKQPVTPPATNSGYVPLPPNAAPPAVERTSVTHHTLHVNGQELTYTATAGTMVLKRDDDKPRASIFYIAYTRDGFTDKSKRPVTFAFNGGPGSASVWMHMGAIGPKRAVLKEDGSLPPAPFRMVDNDNSALDFTDVVFIDPVSTGFSRPAPGEDPKQFHGVEGDLQSVGDFIRMWTTRNERWLSPKFLAGESYGTTRAAGLSQYLLQSYGMYLNGITLLSSVLDFETIRFSRGHDLPYITFLPSYTAVAWYHKKLGADLQADRQKAIQESRHFAATDYTMALMQGDRLPAADRARIAQQVARLTGLNADFVDRSNLRIEMDRFAKELLRSERRTIGRYDGRMEGEDYDAAGESPEYDPSYSVVYGPFAATFNDYVHSELKFDSDMPYELLTGKVQPWNYAPFENRYVNMAEPLREAITESESESNGLQRLLRFSDAVFRHGVHIRSHRAGSEADRKYLPDLLRRRPYVLHQPGVSRSVARQYDEVLLNRDVG